jgi:hypothetical protein
VVKAVLHLAGYFVSGPKASEFVPGGDSAPVAEAIDRLSNTEGYDKDDYTSTPLYMKGYLPESKGSEEMLEFLRLKDAHDLTWEDVFTGSEKAAVLTLLDAQRRPRPLTDSD